MEISGTTTLLGLIGTPVEHSKSPAMYNYSFDQMGLDYKYLAFNIPEEKTGEAIAAMKTFHMRGANITMPCKSAVIPFLDELSPAARIASACNTIINENGKLKGYITDGLGYIRSLKEQDVTVKGAKLTILGSGGAATAIQVQCALDGARELSIFNKKDAFWERAQHTIDNIQKEAPGCIVHLYDLDDTKALSREVSGSDILTNATRIGMEPYENQSNITDLSLFRKNLVVTDVVYSPKKTKMLTEAEQAGCKIIGGLGMLLYQGAEAFKLYTGLEMPVDEVRKIYFQ